MINFSTSNWILFITSLGIVYSLYTINKSTQQILRGTSTQFFGFVLAFLVTIYVGTRPLWCYTDSALYSTIFKLVQSGAWSDLSQSPSEWFFTWIEKICLATTDAHGWFFVIACFYIGGMCYAAWKWLPKHFSLAVMFMFTAFSFWSYSNNGIRQGMGASLVLAGIACLAPKWKKDWINLVPAAVLIILGCACHNSLYLTLFSTIIALLFPNLKSKFIIWGICLLISPFSSEIFMPIASDIIEDERMADYAYDNVSETVFSRTGWRWDFILYSAVPIVLGYYAIVIKKMRYWHFELLLSIYILTNAAWMLVNAIAYSNRFAYISWSLYPLLLCMPLCRLRIFKRQGVVTGLFLIGSIVFNLIF